jgi:anti-anti-sigma factor
MDMPESSPFEVTLRANHGTVVVELAGDFDLSGVETFRSRIEELIASASIDTVVIDLRVSFIDSCGIAALLATSRLFADQDRELRFRHISSAAARVFELTGLTDHFQASADDAT